MKRKIFILRHAKAVPQESVNNDAERALTFAGIKDAEALGRYLKDNKIVPEIIYCSTAVRAQMTMETLMKALLDEGIPFFYSSQIYNGSINDIQSIITSTPDDFFSLMIIGHNPEMELIAKQMLDNNTNLNLTPASLVIIEFDADSWQHIKLNNGNLHLFYPPKS